MRRRIVREKVVQALYAHEIAGDRIAILLLGDLVAVGPPAEVLTEQLIDRVFRTRVRVDRHPSGEFPRVTLMPALEGGS